MTETSENFLSQIDAQSKVEALFHEISLRRQQREEVSRAESLARARNAHQESKKTTLKSDVKKTSMFVNKLRSMNTEGLSQCIRDVETLNLTLYISEIVMAILEISFKPTDVPLIIRLIVALHKRYEDFAPLLLEKLKTATLSPPSTTEDKDTALKKRRIQIRLMLELYEAGVFLEETYFGTLLRQLLGKSKQESGSKKQTDLLGISTFVKYGSEILLGLPSKSVKTLARVIGQELASMPVFLLANPAYSLELRNEIFDVYHQVCGEVVKAYKEFKRKEKKMENDRLVFGTLSEQKQTEWDNAKKLFEKLLNVASVMSESLGEDVPVLEEDKDEEENNMNAKGISVWDGGSNSSNADYNGPFGDLESRSFYEDLPDLLAMVPLALLGLTPEQEAVLQEQWRVERESRYSGPPPAVIPIGNDTDKEADTLTSSSSTSNLENLESSDSFSTETSSKKHSAGDLQELDKDELSSSSNEETPNMRVTLLIQDKLPECTTKAKCDEFCQSFCFLNSKSARKKLAQALVKIPWGRGELVPCYARIIASLHRIFNDIAPVVLNSIQREVTFLTKSKALLSSNQIDSKSKILRYLCELVKFNVAPPIMVLKPCKAFLADFSSHNIDFLSVILESCGRYLYLLPYTHERMESIVDTMLRLRRSKFLDLRQQTLIDSAYFAVKPPDRIQNKKKELTLIQKYIRYLLLDRLCSKNVNVDNLIISLRRLPFNNASEEVERYIIKYALRLARQKYNSIGAIADLFSGIKRFKPNLVIQLIDCLFEEIYRGLDFPYKRDHQRMIGYVRLIGELYNYEVLSSATIFELLYFCLLYGHQKDVGDNLSYTSLGYTNMINYSLTTGNIALSGDLVKLDKFIDRLRMIRYNPSRYDPRQESNCEIDSPNDLFRAQLVVELINTCGEYYTKGQAKEKLNRFLAYFQRYLMCKQAVPLHIEFMILDMFDGLEAHAQGAVASSKGKASSVTAFTRYSSLESVQAFISDLEAKSEAKEELSNGITNYDGDEGSDEEGNRHGHVNNQAECTSDGDGSANDEENDSDREEEDDSISELELAKLREKTRQAETEDEEFEKAFRSVLMDSISTASKSATFKANDVDRMAIPAVLPRPKNVLRPLHDSVSTHNATPESNHNGGVVFKMLSRDTKGRVETRQVLLPETNAIVAKLQRSEEQLRLEKQLIKEKILQLESMQSEDDVSDEAEVYGAGTPYIGPDSSRNSMNPGRGKGRGRGQEGAQTMSASSSSAGLLRSGQYARRGDEHGGKKVIDTLNLDEFLAESAASEIRRMQSNMANSSQSRNR